MSLEKINDLLAAMATNPFYGEKLGGISKVSSLAEFSDKVPFTTKAELAADQKAHPPYGHNLTYPLASYHRFHQTSGTSGQPMTWLDDRAGWAWLLENWAWVWEKAGVKAGQAAFFPFSFGPFLGFWAGFEAAAELGIRVIPAGGLSSENRLKMMARLRPEVLCCTPTYGLRLAELADDARSLGVEKIIVAGEPGGSLPEVRNRLTEAWGAEVIDHHGMTEVGPVTVGDPQDPGRLLIRHEAYFCEVINQDEQGIGELVLTTLGRHGSPLLRYRTGDLVQPDDDFALKGGIIGRADDMVVVRGVNLYPGAVEEVVRSIAGITEYEVLIEQANSMTEVRLRIEGNNPNAAHELEGRLREVFSLRIPVLEVAEGTLERFEMKSGRWRRGSGS